MRAAPSCALSSSRLSVASGSPLSPKAHPEISKATQTAQGGRSRFTACSLSVGGSTVPPVGPGKAYGSLRLMWIMYCLPFHGTRSPYTGGHLLDPAAPEVLASSSKSLSVGTNRSRSWLPPQPVGIIVRRANGERRCDRHAIVRNPAPRTPRDPRLAPVSARNPEAGDGALVRPMCRRSSAKAEGEGFEPSRDRKAPNGFRDQKAGARENGDVQRFRSDPLAIMRSSCDRVAFWEFWDAPRARV